MRKLENCLSLRKESSNIRCYSRYCPLPSSYCLISLSASLIFSPPYFLFPFLLTPTPTSRLIPYLVLPSSPLNPQYGYLSKTLFQS